MNRIWEKVCFDIGIRPPKGYSWYSIRHALFTNLGNNKEIPVMVLDKWGGWKTGQVSEVGMVSIYHAPDSTDMRQLDALVLNNHPFLGYWNEKK